jgi:DNA repair protein RadC
MAGEEHAGHRQRLDDKSNLVGFEFMEEHEQLEKILFAVIPRGNTNEIAHRLLEQCGSLYGVLTADVEELTKVEGVGNRAAQFLHDLCPILGCVERCMMRENQHKHSMDLSTAEAMGKYAKTLFYGKLNEAFYMVSLNKKLQAYRFDKISDGNADETPVYIQQVVKLALRTNAYAVLITHNHPAGTLTPSRADLDTTVSLHGAMDAVGISLLDHIIVGGGDVVSLKQMGLF